MAHNSAFSSSSTVGQNENSDNEHQALLGGATSNTKFHANYNSTNSRSSSNSPFNESTANSGENPMDNWNRTEYRFLRQQMNASHRQQSLHDLETASLHNFLLNQEDNSKAQVYESLDYEICENTLYLQENKKILKERQSRTPFLKYIGSFFASKKEFLRWIIIYIIGTFTALTACIIVLSVETLANIKFNRLQLYYDQVYKKTFEHQQVTNETNSQSLQAHYALLGIPLAFWVISNFAATLVSTLVVTYVAPVAAGSGIPVIKCYLNGVKVPEVVRIKTFLAKLIGVIGSVVGGLTAGKEGPMIHCGSVIAAGISQGKSTTFKKDLKIFTDFREDHEKRDFVSAGAAAGVAAAFGSPIGGVLFSLEEGASFWNQILTWRIFFCSFISTFTLNLVISSIHGNGGNSVYAGLINFGKIETVNYNFIELPFYVMMGIGGGLIGALHNFINYKITLFRMRYVSKRPAKVAEAIFICVLTAVVGFFLVLASSECHPIDKVKENNFIQYPVQLNCKPDEFSTTASLFINTPETVVINMLHMDADMYSVSTLFLFFLVYFCLAVITYGISVSSGLFIPTLLLGSVYGRIIGVMMYAHLKEYCPNLQYNELVSKFALIGAASVLGGVVRMTISLTVILIETTGNITLGLPLMICLILAKWIGDSFNEGIYDIHIKLAKIPFLNCEPHLNNHEIDEHETLFASQLMSSPVVTLCKIEKVSTIVQILQNESYNGFPVVDFEDRSSNSLYKNENNNTSFVSLMKDFGNFEEAKFCQSLANANKSNSPDPLAGISLETLTGDEEFSKDNYLVRLHRNRIRGHYGKLRGFVLRWQLIVLLEKKIFNQTCDVSMRTLNLDIFRDAYPRYPNIQSIISKLTPTELTYTIDLNHIMNPNPYSVTFNFTFNRTFRLFRALGLRHLCIVNDCNDVVGIITRKDIANFQVVIYKNRKYIQKYSDNLNIHTY